MVLNCQVPSAITGPVAWTIPEWDTPPKKPLPVLSQKRIPWIGISAEFGSNVENDLIGRS